MQNKFFKTPLGIIEQNISYYNAIAGKYDVMVNKNSDKTVRQKVAAKFSDIVKNSSVLDFGGGTGLDLEWLTKNNNKIFFCEPSKAMREIAISECKNLLNQNIIFLDDFAADFRQWHKQLPVAGKIDAVLANFAVMNCIPGIKSLFKELSLIIKPGGNVIALILRKDSMRIQGTNFKNVLGSAIFRVPQSINIHYQNHRQTVYIYSIKEIIKASKNDFIFCSNETIPGTDFTLIHLTRK